MTRRIDLRGTTPPRSPQDYTVRIELSGAELRMIHPALIAAQREAQDAARLRKPGSPAAAAHLARHQKIMALRSALDMRTLRALNDAKKDDAE